MTTKQRLTVPILLFLFLSAYACSSDNSQSQSTTKETGNENTSDSTEAVTEILKTKSVESYTIDDRSVTFFMLNKKEQKELIKTLGTTSNYEVPLMFRNFNEMAQSMRWILKKYDINVHIETAPAFAMTYADGKAEVYNRKEDEQILGQILFDGKQKALIEFGMYRNKDLLNLVKEYFQIDKINNNALDSIQQAANTEANDSTAQ